MTDLSPVAQPPGGLEMNAVGQTIIRRVTLNGADLTLSSVPDPKGNYRRIRWRRVAGQ